MQTLDDLLEPLLGLDGRPAPLAGPLRDHLRAVVTRLDTQLEQRAERTPTDLYLRGQGLIGRFRTVHRVPDRGLHQAVVAELADPASPLRAPLWTELGDLAGRLLILLHRDGPPQARGQESRLVLALVGLLLRLTHPEVPADPEVLQGTAPARRGRDGAYEGAHDRAYDGAHEGARDGAHDSAHDSAHDGAHGGAYGTARGSARDGAPEPAWDDAPGETEEETAGPPARFLGGTTGRAGMERGDPLDLVMRLRDEFDRLYQDTSVYLGEPDEAPVTASGLWIALHVACLRLPGAIAQPQREHFARTFGSTPGKGVVPALPVIGFPGLGDPRGPDEGRWRSPRAIQMYDILVTMFAVAELDPRIYHGLDEMARDAQNPIRLDAETRRQYQERAWTRLRQLDELPPGSDLEEIRYLAWVDEVVCSFFPLPLPAPESWWAELYRRSRGLVLEAVRAAGGKVDILDDRTYDRALRKKLSGTQMSMPVREEADVDRVLWTLRLPWEFDGSGDSGRVIYGVRRR